MAEKFYFQTSETRQLEGLGTIDRPYYVRRGDDGAQRSAIQNGVTSIYASAGLPPPDYTDDLGSGPPNTVGMANSQYGVRHANIRLLRAIKGSKCRVELLGDAWVDPSTDEAIFDGALVTWTPSVFAALRFPAVSAGYLTVTEQLFGEGESSWHILVDADNGFIVGDQEVGIRYSVPIGHPVRQAQFVSGVESTDGTYYTMAFDATAFGTESRYGPLTQSGQRVKARILFVGSGSGDVDAFVAADGDGSAPQTFNLSTSGAVRTNPWNGSGGSVSVRPGELHAAYPDILITSNITTTPSIDIGPSGAVPAGSDKYLCFAGALFWRVSDVNAAVPVDGMYLGVMGGSADWTLAALANARPSLDGSPAFTNDSFGRSVAATQYDLSMPVYFVLMHEPNIQFTQSDYEREYGRLLDRIRLVSSRLKIPMHLVIIGMPAHFPTGADSYDQAMEACEIQNRAADAVAMGNGRDCAFISLLAATDGFMLVDDETSGKVGNRAEWVQWLSDNGYDDFEIGEHTEDLTMLDSFFDESGRLPGSHDAANFFASLIWDVIEEAASLSAATRFSRVADIEANPEGKVPRVPRGPGPKGGFGGMGVR